MANISANDLLSFREYAAIYLAYTNVEMDDLVAKGTLHPIEAPKENANG